MRKELSIYASRASHPCDPAGVLSCPLYVVGEHAQANGRAPTEEDMLVKPTMSEKRMVTFSCVSAATASPFLSRRATCCGNTCRRNPRRHYLCHFRYLFPRDIAA